MQNKLALKRLTASDLTFFEWYFKNKNAGNQKAINLNADVFILQLYPYLNQQFATKIGVDLWISGPNATGSVNLQRKIIKGESYKNWRLDGEMVHDTVYPSARLNQLNIDDIAVLGFEGKQSPRVVNLILVGSQSHRDKALFSMLNGVLRAHSMIAIERRALEDQCKKNQISRKHPIWSVIDYEDLAEAAAGQAPATARLQKSPTHRSRTPDEFREARESWERTGRQGEELVDSYLRQQVDSGTMTDYRWVANMNAISPHDFMVKRAVTWEKLEIKTTSGGFNREFHLPLSELRDMAYGVEEYRIGRVYDLSDAGAKLRVSKKLRQFGRSILATVNFPRGVTLNGVTIRPYSRDYAEEIELAASSDHE